MTPFIVIDGIDDEGNAQHAKVLAEALGGVHTREPTTSAVGRLLFAILEGREDPVTPWAAALLFAADRAEHQQEIAALLEEGRPVVGQRYVPSSLAFQTAAPGQPGPSMDDVWALNSRFRVPDLTVFLDVPPSHAAARMARRPGEQQLFEDRYFEVQIQYEAAFALLAERGWQWITVDGTDPGRAHADILAAVMALPA